MPPTEPFETLTDRYDHWFEDHEPEYRAELAALERIVPTASPGLEVGVGTGRFAGPLDVGYGLDPAPATLELARERGVDPVIGVGEELPFPPDTFATVLLVTTVCFVDDLAAAFREARRVMAPEGSLVLGYIDQASPLGQRYEARREENPFYRGADFKTTDEILATLDRTGFAVDRTVQTLFPEATDQVRDGYGEGSFVGVISSPASNT
jgi:SAM-dependent methyltransferase